MNMKYVLRLTIILGISMLGELLSAWIPLPIPGSVYGLVLMLAGLCTGVIPLEKVRGTGSFLVEIMPVMFIPAAVGIINSWDALRPVLLPVVVIMVVSTFVVMGAAGLVTQALMRRRKARTGGEVRK